MPRSGSGAQERAGFLPGQQGQRGPQSPRDRGKQEPIRGCEITEGKTMKGPHVAWRKKGKQQCFPQPPCTPVPPTNYRPPTTGPACNLRPKTFRGPTHPTPPQTQIAISLRGRDSAQPPLPTRDWPPVNLHPAQLGDQPGLSSGRSDSSPPPLTAFPTPWSRAGSGPKRLFSREEKLIPPTQEAKAEGRCLLLQQKGLRPDVSKKDTEGGPQDPAPQRGSAQTREGAMGEGTEATACPHQFTPLVPGLHQLWPPGCEFKAGNRTSRCPQNGPGPGTAQVPATKLSRGRGALPYGSVPRLPAHPSAFQSNLFCSTHLG